jgi:phosphoglycolate phosphatase
MTGTPPLAGATIVFDLDGTLIDTAPDLAGGANAALAAEGRPPVTVDSLRHMVGYGGKAMIEHALEATGGPVTEARLDEIHDVFIEHYVANISATSHPYPGLLNALDQLAAAGAKLAICTNKRESLALKLMDELGLLNRFAALIGRDTLPVCKPAPEPVLEAVARSNGDPSRSIMVGDTSIDVNAAHAAGLKAVVVRFGYPDMDYDAMNGDAMIDHYDDLGVAIEKLLG